MQICDKCHVTIRGDWDVCPLCGSRIQGEKEPSVFPDVSSSVGKYRMLLRWTVFISVAAGILSIAFNSIFRAGGIWSLFVLAGLASVWVSLFMAMKKLQNMQKNIVWQTVVLSILAVLWDVATGWHNWSLDFVLPILCTTAIGMMFLFAKIMQQTLREYLVYMLILLFMGGVVLVLLLLGLIHVLYPALICVTGCGLLLAALIIFKGDLLKGELYKRLHL